jgi:hypothetical protein
MAEALLQCPTCRTRWPQTIQFLAELERCPGCSRSAKVIAFPALEQHRAPGAAGEAILVEGEAACFNHPKKRAVVPCARCGRYLCGLCDLELMGQHLCASCVEQGRQRGEWAELETGRVLYDHLALMLAAVSYVIPFVGFISAPAAVAVVIYGWRKPRSIVAPGRMPAWVALALSAGFAVLCSLILVMMSR